MTVNEIPNINHCTVELVGNGRGYRITAHEGWYIHLNDGIEGSENVYKGAVILMATYDFTQVEIVPESELPEGSEIHGGNNEPEAETM